MEVIVEKHIPKKLKKFPKYVVENFTETARVLKDWPNVRLDVRKLKGRKEKIFRVRIGRYRIVFILEDDVLRIAEFDLRGKGYD